MHHKTKYMSSNVIQVKDEIINLDEVAYVTKRKAQKAHDDPTEIDVVTVLLKSGSPINMPFEEKNTADFVHKRIADNLGAVKLNLPELKKS